MTRRGDAGGRPIDWPAVRERLGALEEAASRVPSREQTRALLDERARALARPHGEPADADARLAVITFAIAAERYAIETKYVRQIVQVEEITPVPGVPGFVVGVATYRGEILCVVDLRHLVGAPTGGLSDLTRLVIVGLEAAEFAVLADRVEGSPSLRADEILPAPEAVPVAARRLVRGVTREALVVVNGAALLDDPRLVIDGRGTGEN